MNVLVAINEPRLLGELVEELTACDCAVRNVSERAIEVAPGRSGGFAITHPELVFFLRAWAGANPAADVVFL
jgi:hypothetical protein